MSYKIHPLADVQTTAIGDNTAIWQFCVILKGAKIGNHCNICAHCLIENDVEIGNMVTVKSGVQLWDGISVADNVFIGPNVTFTNDRYPRSKSEHWKLVKTTIGKGASIGANATILGGITIGQYSMIGAGSMVTTSIPPNTVWYGNPARHKGYVTNEGVVLTSCMTHPGSGEKYAATPQGLIKL